MSLIMSWGKCSVKVAANESALASATGVTPVEGTTTLNVTEGNKTEATEEGGGVVAVRYAKDKYELQFATREKLTGITDDDGVITGIHAVKLETEEVGATNIKIAKCHMKCTPSYSSSDGIMYTYKCAAIRDSDSPSIVFEADT